MHTGHSSRTRRTSPSSEGGPQGQTRDQGGVPHVSHREDPSQLCVTRSNRDLHCPVCLQTATFPVETNCGHLFCAPCLISYWKHGSWFDAINCPLCRQKVSVMCHLFSESRPGPQEREVLGHIKDYNKRYSGASRPVTDYLCDAPRFLQLLLRGLANMSGLVWLFLLRVALCGLGALASLSSPLEGVPGPLCRALAFLDDLVVVFLLLICLLNINQQVAPERTARTRITAMHGVLTDAL